MSSDLSSVRTCIKSLFLHFTVPVTEHFHNRHSQNLVQATIYCTCSISLFYLFDKAKRKQQIVQCVVFDLNIAGEVTNNGQYTFIIAIHKILWKKLFTVQSQDHLPAKLVKMLNVKMSL